MEVMSGGDAEEGEYGPPDTAVLEADWTPLCPHDLGDGLISLGCFSWLSTRERRLRLLESCVFAVAVALLIARSAAPAFRS